MEWRGLETLMLRDRPTRNPMDGESPVGEALLLCVPRRLEATLAGGVQAGIFAWPPIIPGDCAAIAALGG